MTRPSFARRIFHTVLAPVALASACATPLDPQPRSAAGNDGPVSSLVASLRQVPTRVQCLRVVASVAGQSFEAQTGVPGPYVELTVGNLPLGAGTVQAFGYDAACSTSTPQSTPSWRSDSASTQLTAASSAYLELSLFPNAPTEVNASFRVDIVDFALGNAGCAIGADDRAYCTTGDTVSQTHAVIDGVAVQSLALGSGVQTIPSFAILESGLIRAWGHNGLGQLGDGTTTPRQSGLGTQVANLTNAYAVANGNGFACAIADSGALKRRVFCWGNNNNKQLGDGTVNASLVPVATRYQGYAHTIELGSGHACILNNASGVTCWGGNSFSVLGATPDAYGYTNPIAAGAVDIATASNATFALMADGTVRAWGTYLATGSGDTATVTAPKTIPGLTNIVQITAGGTGACALNKSGQVYCWGDGYTGAVGDGAYAHPTSPVLVSRLGNTVHKIFSGMSENHCALHLDGHLDCWGQNGFGQLGDDTQLNRFVPTRATRW